MAKVRSGSSSPPSSKLDLCGINEFIHNISAHHLLLSHEGASGNAKTVRVNGDPATFQELQNATDSGNGIVSFAGGANQNFNRNASTVETITEFGEYFEVFAGATGQFDTQWVTLRTDPALRAHNADFSETKIRLAGTGYQVFDEAGAVVASGGTENGTYRFEKVLYGIRVSRNGVVIFDPPKVCINYEDGDAPGAASVLGNTGWFQIGSHDLRDAPVTIANTTIETGFDFLTNTDQLRMKILVRDDANSRPWSWEEVDVRSMVDRSNAGDSIASYVHVFDNDYIRIDIQDAATGSISLIDTGRAMEYAAAELWMVAPEQEAIFQLANVPAFSTTATFQGFGDPDARITGADGDVVHVEYGDGNRDAFTFLAGVARAERRGFGSNDIELAVSTGGQLQIKDNNAQSGIIQGWYQPLRGLGVTVETVEIPEDIDVIPEFDDALKSGFGRLIGRPYTVLEDASTLVAVSARAYDGVTYPVVEIEFVKDAAATHAAYLRANTPGSGRQAQVRMHLGNGTAQVSSSGANTSDPVIEKTIVGERTIKHVIRFTDAVPHTELELAPAGADASLVNTPAVTGQTSVLGLNLYTTSL